MLTMREKLELEELENLNNNMKDEKEYEVDNRFGAFVLLISYFGIGLFMFYKIAELLVKKFS